MVLCIVFTGYSVSVVHREVRNKQSQHIAQVPVAYREQSAQIRGFEKGTDLRPSLACADCEEWFAASAVLDVLGISVLRIFLLNVIPYLLMYSSGPFCVDVSDLE